MIKNYKSLKLNSKECYVNKYKLRIIIWLNLLILLIVLYKRFTQIS